jgi:hypothetical protein
MASYVPASPFGRFTGQDTGRAAAASLPALALLRLARS